MLDFCRKHSSYIYTHVSIDYNDEIKSCHFKSDAPCVRVIHNSS